MYLLQQMGHCEIQLTKTTKNKYHFLTWRARWVCRRLMKSNGLYIFSGPLVNIDFHGSLEFDPIYRTGCSRVLQFLFLYQRQARRQRVFLQILLISIIHIEGGTKSTFKTQPRSSQHQWWIASGLIYIFVRQMLKSAYRPNTQTTTVSTLALP